VHLTSVSHTTDLHTVMYVTKSSTSCCFVEKLEIVGLINFSEQKVDEMNAYKGGHACTYVT
jgi:hypothetical protein